MVVAQATWKLEERIISLEAGGSAATWKLEERITNLEAGGGALTWIKEEVVAGLTVNPTGEEIRWVKEEVVTNLSVSPSEIEPPPTCQTDADCPEGYVCENGVCVEKKEFPWVPVALAVGGALVVVAATTIKTKKVKLKKT